LPYCAVQSAFPGRGFSAQAERSSFAAIRPWSNGCGWNQREFASAVGAWI
jgi:hypothetical protein